MRHLIDPLDFTREETDALLNLSSRLRAAAPRSAAGSCRMRQARLSRASVSSRVHSRGSIRWRLHSTLHGRAAPGPPSSLA